MSNANQTMPTILVISLERAPDRRKSITNQFGDLGLPFEFLDAVDGKQGHELFERFDAAKAKKIGEIPLSAGHLGCYASHCLAWMRSVENNEPLIVLEDDAKIFEKEFKAFLDVVPNLPESIECVRLFSSKSRNTQSIPVFESGEVSISKFLRGHKSATGYYVKPSAAKKFLDYAKTWVEPLDIEMDQFWENGVECYGVMTPCLTHNPEFDSGIDFGINTRLARRGLMRWRWRWYLAKGKVRRNLHNASFARRHRRAK